MCVCDTVYGVWAPLHWVKCPSIEVLRRRASLGAVEGCGPGFVKGLEGTLGQPAKDDAIRHS